MINFFIGFVEIIAIVCGIIGVAWITALVIGGLLHEAKLEEE